MNSVELAYVQGFVQKCGEAGINPDALAKFAVQVGPAGGQLMAAAPAPAGGQLMAPAPTKAQLDAFKAKARPQLHPIAADQAAKKEMSQ